MKNKIYNKVDIYEYMAQKVTRYFEKRLELKSDDLERLNLGVTVVLINIFKMLLVCVAASFFGILKETILLIIVFGSVRVNAVGIHLKSSFLCTVACLIVYLGDVYLALNYSLNNKVAFFISIFLVVLLYKYSPADTENRPILGREHRRKLKIRTVKIAILILIMNLLIGNELIFNLTMYAFLTEVICISPFTYKLLNKSYNNYAEYE